MLAPLTEHTRRALEASLASPALLDVAAALHRHHADRACERIVASITTSNGLQRQLTALKADLAAGEPAYAAGSFERLLIMREQLKALPRLASLPVSDDVKRLFCEECQYVAAPPRGAVFDAVRGSFVALCEVATLRRFPAGQLHWNVSGLPRSWLLKVRGRARLTLLAWVATRLRGFRPVFFPHLNAHRKSRWVLTEQESNRSYYRMAQSMMHQPDVKGLVASSWLHSPDTFAVSPHLSWMNQTFLDNGGLVVIMGPADPDCGVLSRSPERKKLYEAGLFKPTTGLILWPRRDMLAWAVRHPELAQPEVPVDAQFARHAS
jgi:hypothetical protein